MKKNYLLVTLMSALVLSGCNGGSTSSSSNSSVNSSIVSNSSSAKSLATVEDAVEKLTYNYTVDYTKATSQQEFSVLVEDTPTNEIILFFEQSNDGFYFNENNEAYYLYLNGDNEAIYNSTGLIKSEYAESIKTSIDMKSAFLDASWELVSEGKEIVYYTEDVEALAVASFLTECSETEIVSSLEVSIKPTSTSAKLTGFTTYDEAGEVIAEADIEKIGLTYATDDMPELNDNVDSALYGMWYTIFSQSENAEVEGVIGGEDSFFEIVDADDKTYLLEYAIEGEYLKTSEIFTYVAPSGIGTYIFSNEIGDLVEIYSANGSLVSTENGQRLYNTTAVFSTIDKETGTMSQGFSISYYEVSFISSILSFNEKYQSTGKSYEFELIQPGTQEYDAFVTDCYGIGAYYVTELDANGQEVQSVVFTQWSSIDSIIYNLNQLMSTSGGFTSTLYNGCALGGYIYATFFLIAGSNDATSINVQYDLSEFLRPEYAEVNTTKYPEVLENQSCVDYVKSSMVTLGYTIIEDEYVIVDTVTGEGTDYISFIQEVNTDEELGITCEDVIFFEDKNGQFGCILVINENGTSFVTTLGFGYYITIGQIYELIYSWTYAQAQTQA